MTATVTNIAKSGEDQQTKRFRWREAFNGYYVDDTLTGQTRGIGDGVDLFCQAAEGVPDEDEPDCFSPGTQRFYNALNEYFNNEQQEIAECYFGVFLPDEEVASNG